MGSMRVQAWCSIKLKETGGVWRLVVNGEMEGEEAGDKVIRHGTCVKEKASKTWNKGMARFAFSTACSAGLDTGRLFGGGCRNPLETEPGWCRVER